MLYRQGTQRLERLDQRSTSYRFDLERDPEWERADEHGVHAPNDLLVDVGIDVEVLAPFAETFDWVFAASVSRLFALLELNVVEFIERERASIVASASLDSLVAEELKHVALFRRYEEVLLARRDRASFDRWFAPMGARLHTHNQKVAAVTDPASRHWLFWMHTLFFEEFTLYLDERLQAATGIQPTWLQMHRLHRIEELQHAATDQGYLEALALPEQATRELSRGFVFGLLHQLHDTVAIAPAVAAVQELGAVRLCQSGSVTRLPFVRDMLTRAVFRRSRSFAPAFGELLGG